MFTKNKTYHYNVYVSGLYIFNTAYCLRTNQNQMMVDNRRKFARIYLDSKIKVLFRGSEQRYQLLLDNISEGGLFIASDQVKPIGTKIHFEFRVDDGGETISGSGVVRWIESDPSKRKGMGIQFTEINAVGKEIISRLYRQKGIDQD